MFQILTATKWTSFDLQEVDEDNIVEPESNNLRGSVGTVASCSSFKSETDLNASFQLFYQSIKAGNDDDPIGLDIPANNCGIVLSPEKSSTGERPCQPSHNNSTPNTTPTAPIVISLNTRSRQSFWSIYYWFLINYSWASHKFKST